ncbi:hypothetical protein ACJX0J_015724, partial [Zea mays]
ARLAALNITTFAHECPLMHGSRNAGSGPRGIEGKPSPLEVPISAADPEVAQANVLAVGNMFPEQSAEENDAANLEATSAQSVVVDVPIGSVSKEATEPETSPGDTDISEATRSACVLNPVPDKLLGEMQGLLANYVIALILCYVNSILHRNKKII